MAEPAGAVPDRWAPGRAPDQSARDRVLTDLGATLFVEAGAGSGKTSMLVGRVLALVTSGRAELGRIAAITFTEKAAAELRDRIRSELEAVGGSEGIEAQRCCSALGQLDGAAIGTLHAFAQRILIEHPIEAGLPPRIEVLDEVGSAVAFEQRWSMFQDQLLADPAMERTLLLLFASGVRIEALRYLAQTFEENWDLVDERVPASVHEPPSPVPLLRGVFSDCDLLLAEPCARPDDKLRQRIEVIAEHVRELEGMDELELLEALGPNATPKGPSFNVGGVGKAPSWDDVRAVRARVSELGERLQAVRTTVAQACAQRVAAELRGFVLASAGQRRRDGQLHFHDLLVLARALLRDPVHGPAARTHLHDRYPYLLLDEFQDTDPIQIDLAARIAAAAPASQTSGSEPWEALDVEPGQLFLVGDPKQSIYRFRRADIATFLAAQDRFGARGGRVELTANFRSGAPVIEWVNATFGRLMEDGDDIGVPVPSQPRYVPLVATRPTASRGAPVSVIGREEQPGEPRADQVRQAEAAAVAASVRRVLDEGWTVDDGGGGWRKAALGDVAILVPARTSLPFLEDALGSAGIPFRAESSSLVYASRAVRDLLMVLRAVDDPTDHLAIVSALRTPLLACGDDDLFRFHRLRRGRWSYLADQPDTVPDDDPVLGALGYLRALYDERQWRAPSELLERIARDRRAFELGFGEGRPRDVWRRARFVTDQARAWYEATGGNLRQYLAWVGRQSAEGARTAEAVLPETDDDAVRIMTIHSAKGLEFPVVVVSGMSTMPQVQRAPAQVVFPPTGDVAYRFGSHVTTEAFEEWRPFDEQMSYHERIRLLYVACTRARDHLVVSLHRKVGKKEPQPSRRTNAELLVHGMGGLLAQLPDADGAVGESLRPPAPAVPWPPPFEAWREERASALARASQHRTVAATALSDEGSLDVEVEPDEGLQKRPRDLDLPPWMKGRYGSAVGRAVHGVLQTIDLAGVDDLGPAVAAQCEAEAVPERARDVRSLVEKALGAPSVRQAASAEHWREVYVCTPVEGRLLEGYVDLLYRAPEGLVVLDYKTASTADPDELDRRVERYRNQGASYALSVSAATGEPVVRVTFLFLTPTGAVERHLGDLDDAVRHARRLVASGLEVVVP
jgi:ATP-dependent exoDNAse (exonuclease V) beta subunit